MKSFEMEISNHRGALQIKEDSGRYYWAIECGMDDEAEWEWEEIPTSLYHEMIEFYNGKGDYEKKKK
jgi:hypothetical protein